MKAETLRAEVVTALQELAWDEWSQLGVSAAAPKQREERAADPEALLLLTLTVGRTDPRLFDEMLGWLALNEPLVSVHRLRNLSTDPVDRALAEAALEWVARIRRPARKVDSPPIDDPAALVPLFPSIHTPAARLDPAFAHHGFARPTLQPSGKSQAPRLREPISFGLRLRRLLGVGVRAEVLRVLLTVRADRLSGRVITASAAFAQRNVREGLTQLVDAGVVEVIELADDRYYSTRASEWAGLLGLMQTSDLPFFYDWIPACRALTRILRWLQRPETDELSPYLLASQARTLVEEIEPDLRQLNISPQFSTARGEAYWNDFVEMSRAAIRSARGPVR
jgi:hypothetical protein